MISKVMEKVIILSMKGNLETTKGTRLFRLQQSGEGTAMEGKKVTEKTFMHRREAGTVV